MLARFAAEAFVDSWRREAADPASPGAFQNHAAAADSNALFDTFEVAVLNLVIGHQSAQLFFSD